MKYPTTAYIIFSAIMLSPSFVSALTIGVSIPEKYSQIAAGEKVYFETDVKWPENDGRKDLRIEYSVKDNNGTEVAYLKVLKAIETQASFMDAISIPESTSPGMYKIGAKFNDYQNMDQEVVASFKVIKSGRDIELYMFIIIGLLCAILIFAVVDMVLIARKHDN